MPSRALLCCLLVWMAGCARNTRPDSETAPRYEHVFLKPLEEALAETRKLFQEKGYRFEPTDDPAILLTTWDRPLHWQLQWGNQYQFRYMVTGLRLGARKSVIRIFRMSRSLFSNNSEQRPNLYKFMQYEHTIFESMENSPIEKANQDRGVMKGTRAMDVEKELTARLEASAGIEVIAKNVAPEADLPLLREPSFYLARWKQEGTAEPAELTPCPQEVRGLTELLKPGRSMIIGEQLGSKQAPAVVGDMVCQSAAAGFTVTLGLSIPRTEQESINRYLASPGAPADQDELLRGNFWRRPFQDGRSSRAIMDLIDRVRFLRNYGLFITVVAYDTEEATSSERDALLAKVWDERRKAHPDEVFIILTGNMHARTVQGAQWDPNFVPMAKYMMSTEPALLALDLSYAKGRRWGCNLNNDSRLDCAVVGASPSPRVAAPPGLNPYVTMFPQPTEEGYHGMLYVGALSASLPATSLENDEEPKLSVKPRLPVRNRQPMDVPPPPPPRQPASTPQRR